MFFKQLLSFVTLTVTVYCQATTPDNFGLFGYSEGLGGFPLFYSEGYAYIGDPSYANSSDAAVVQFSPGTESEYVWIGSPNTTFTGGSNATWANVTFYVPTESSQDKRIGFVNGGNTTDDVTTSGFAFYGHSAMLLDDQGMSMSWFALRVSERVHALYWNDTSLGQQPVILRSIAPSNPEN